MAKVTSAWARPIQGVSQQSPQVRIQGQCSAQVNAIPSVVEGLIKRWGTQHIARLMDTLPEGTKFHFYNRGDAEQYFMIFPPNSLPRIFSAEGIEATLEVKAGTDYVKCSDPRSQLSLVTISDTTFIANNQVTPLASEALTTGLSNVAIVSTQFADYGKTYKVTVDGSYSGSFKTPTGEDANDIDLVDTTYVATQVYNSLQASISADRNYTVTRSANTLYIKRSDGTIPTVVTEDGRDGDDLIVVAHRVTEVNKLPTRAPVGYLVEVVGQGDESGDDYWLVAEENEGGSVAWRETTGPEQSAGFDVSTLPHSLVRSGITDGVATFTLNVAGWEDRAVGTEDSNDFPAFVTDGTPIQSMGTFQNRLYVTAGQTVTFTQSNYFFNFFRRTTRSNLDDQRIEVYADTDEINYLTNGCILDGDLVLFSEKGQFMMRGDQAMTYENASLRLVSQYKSSMTAIPVASGNVVFFPFKYGEVSGMRELYTDTYTDTKKARTISEHVNGYIKGEIVQMTTSTNLNSLLILAGDSDTVYTYDWQFQDQERVQSAWGKWVFEGSSVRFVYFDRDTIYLLIERQGEGLYLESMNTGDPDEDGLSFPVRLDRLHRVTATQEGRKWRFSHDLLSASLADYLFVQGPGCDNPGASVYVQEDEMGLYSNETLASAGGSVTLLLGERYEMKYIPTPPFIKDQNDQAIGTDRLTVHRVLVNYDAIGEVSVDVTNAWKVSRQYTFNGRQVGQFDNIVGFSAPGAGQFAFPVHQLSERATYTLTSTSHVPFKLRGMEWEGSFKQRGRRI